MREPMRVIEGNTRPYEPFWTIRDASQTESGEAEIDFFGPISEYSWWGDEITPKAFKEELYAKAKGGPVTLKVNSPGGEVFAASTIRAILQDYPGRITADIIGLAASAATFVVSGADYVRMRDTAMFMIHDPSAIAWGTIEKFEQVLAILKDMKETILNGYAAKTGRERAELAEMMRAETWMTADKAAEYGFVDEVVSGNVAKAPKNTLRAGFLNCVRGLGGVPEEFMRELMQETSPQPSPEGEGEETSPLPSPEGEGEETEAQEEETSPQPSPKGEGEGEAGTSEPAESVEDRDEQVAYLRNYLAVFGPRKELE